MPAREYIIRNDLNKCRMRDNLNCVIERTHFLAAKEIEFSLVAHFILTVLEMDVGNLSSNKNSVFESEMHSLYIVLYSPLKYE